MEWNVDNALALPWPDNVQGLAELVLDKGNPAQLNLQRWVAVRDGADADSTAAESRRLSGLGCVIAAQEACQEAFVAGTGGEAGDVHREMLKQARMELRKMRAEFEHEGELDRTKSAEKLAELVALTGRSERACKTQLRLCDGDVNRAAGRMLNLKAGDASTNRVPEQTPPSAVGDSSSSEGDEVPEANAEAEAEPQAEPEAESEPTDVAENPLGKQEPEPSRPDEEAAGPNHAFYTNARKIRSVHSVDSRPGVVTPDLRCLTQETRSQWGYTSTTLTFDGTIDDFHQAFNTRDAFSYGQLEGRHDYIQWLFPSPERSRFNSGSYPLAAAEAEAIANDPAAKARLLKSYQLILDFWGFEMKDEETGELRRKLNVVTAEAAGGGTDAHQLAKCPPEATCAARFRNLNTPGNHNFMRISRILNCLNACGFGHFAKPFLSSLYQEVFVEGTLRCCRDSFARFWMKLVGEDWEAVAKADFPEAHAHLQAGWHRPRPHGSGLAFGQPQRRHVEARPQQVGVCFWNYSDATVDVNVSTGGHERLAVSLKSNSKHGMYSTEGAEFAMRLLPQTAEPPPIPFGNWHTTSHKSQQVFVENDGADYVVRAIVCHGDDARFEEYRMNPIGSLIKKLQDDGEAVSVAAICKRGNLQQWVAPGAPPSYEQAEPAPAADAPYQVGDVVQVHSQSSGGWCV